MHSSLLRLGLLLSSCCAIGVCAARVHTVWLQLVKVLSESAFVWIKSLIKPFTLAYGFSPASGPDFMTSDFSELQVVTGVRAPRCAAEPVHAESRLAHVRFAPEFVPRQALAESP